MTLIAASAVPATSKLRLAILYALRYQKLPGNSIAGVVEALIRNGVTADRARLVYIMLNFAGADVRQDDLFMNENFFSRGKTALRGLKVSVGEACLWGVVLMILGRRECLHAAHASSGDDARSAGQRPVEGDELSVRGGG